MWIVIASDIVHNDAILNSTKTLRWWKNQDEEYWILANAIATSVTSAVKDWEQKSWEQAVISCDQTTDSKGVVTNRSERAPSATHSFKYKRLAGAGGETRIMSFVVDYYYLERWLLLFYLRWLAWINNSQFLSSILLLNWLKLWKDGDACRRSPEMLSGHRKSDKTGDS